MRVGEVRGATWARVVGRAGKGEKTEERSGCGVVGGVGG